MNKEEKLKQDAKELYDCMVRLDKLCWDGPKAGRGLKQGLSAYLTENHIRYIPDIVKILYEQDMVRKDPSSNNRKPLIFWHRTESPKLQHMEEVVEMARLRRAKKYADYRIREDKTNQTKVLDTTPLAEDSKYIPVAQSVGLDKPPTVDDVKMQILAEMLEEAEELFEKHTYKVEEHIRLAEEATIMGKLLRAKLEKYAKPTGELDQ